MTPRANEAKSRLDRQDATAGRTTGSRRVRPKLWQVVSVDSSAGTCTVQGVRAKDDGTLETDSTREKTGVLYDPGNEPSTGDRGHLKTLSGGKPFFFKKQRSSLFTFANSRLTGDSRREYPHIFQIYKNGAWETTDDRWAAYKLNTPWEPGGTVRCLWSDNIPIYQTEYRRYETHSSLIGVEIEWQWELLLIMEDFDLSNIDRDALASLTTERLLRQTQGCIGEAAPDEETYGRANVVLGGSLNPDNSTIFGCVFLPNTSPSNFITDASPKQYDKRRTIADYLLDPGPMFVNTPDNATSR